MNGYVRVTRARVRLVTLATRVSCSMCARVNAPEDVRARAHATLMLQRINAVLQEYRVAPLTYQLAGRTCCDAVESVRYCRVVALSRRVQ